MDRIGSNPESVMKQMKEKLGVTPLPLQIPIGREEAFAGVVDLITMQAVYAEGPNGETLRRAEIPAEYLEQAQEARAEMLETLSLYDDELMMALLEEAEIDEQKIHELIREVTLKQDVTPVLMGTAVKNKGVQVLLDAITRYLPSPLDRNVSALDVKSQGQTDENGQPIEPKRIPLEAEDDKPLVSMAFKTVVEQFGQLTYFRIYQGQIKKGDQYVNMRTGKKVRFGRLVRMHADQREDIDQAGAGDIIAVVGVDCASGDTFCGEGINVSLENIFVPEPVVRRSIEPLARDGADKLSKALERFRREDPTFQVSSDEETGETIIAGMGQLHLDVYIERIRREYGVECIVGEPKVAYRECPTRAVAFDHRLKKQTGGSGQFAHIKGVMEPLPDDAEATYEFVNEVTQGRIPKEYIPAVDKGFQDALNKGPLGEWEVVGVRMRLQDGQYHDVDSSEMAFRTCAWHCLRDTLLKAGVAVQEPIMNLEIEVPEEFTGTVSGHLSSKRGLINSSETRNKITVILAEVPLASMFDYANELRSLTQGKGTFSMEFAKYRQVPTNLQEEIVKRRKAEKEERMALAR
jgi:elongation factor G